MGNVSANSWFSNSRGNAGLFMAFPHFEFWDRLMGVGDCPAFPYPSPLASSPCHRESTCGFVGGHRLDIPSTDCRTPSRKDFPPRSQLPMETTDSLRATRASPDLMP